MAHPQSNLAKNRFATFEQLATHYDFGGWSEIARNRDINTSGLNSGPSGEARKDWVHRYLNRELNLPEGQHNHSIDALSGPVNKVKNGEVTISPFDKAINYKNIS